MNKTLKGRVIRHLQDASKTYAAIADKQKKAGLDKSANVTLVRKIQIDSVIADVEATIDQSPKPQPKKKPVKKSTKKENVK